MPLAVSFAAPLFLLVLLVSRPGSCSTRGASAPGPRPRRLRHARAMLPAVAPRPSGWRRHVPLAFYALALAALALALARPQATRAVDVEQASVVLAFDQSGSMAATDVKPNRLEAARRAADVFLRAVPKKVRVGAVAFSDAPRVVQGPTVDRQGVRDALDVLQPQGGTATGDALDLALRTARRPAPARRQGAAGGHRAAHRRRLRQGQGPARGGPPGAAACTCRSTPSRSARRAGRSPSPGAGAARRPSACPRTPPACSRVAQASGGRTFSAQDASQLDAVYRRLGSQVATERRPREITASFAAGALVALVAGGLLSLRWFGRLP